MKPLTIIPNSLALWGLGQMGLVIQGPDATILLDPCLTDIIEEITGPSGKRAFPSPLDPATITYADYYLITHEHLDHLDRNAVKAVAQASPQCKFVTTRWCQPLLAEQGIPTDRIIFPEALHPMTLPGTSLRITATPSAHYEKEYDEQMGYRFMGFVLEWNGVTLYHSGDTIIYEGYIEMLQKLPRADIAMIAANGGDWFREQTYDIVGNMQPIEAVRLAQLLHWDTLIFGHHDLLAINAIPQGHMTEAMEKVAPQQKFKILRPGELLYYVKE